MQRIILAVFMVATVIAGFSLPPAQAAETASPPSISVDADGKVMATPDLARLILEVETQAATAAAAGQENAKQTNALLAAVKPALGPDDKLRTLGYRLQPVHAYKDKSSPPEIKGYRAANQLEVKILDVARMGPVIDTAMKNGATRVNGPYWSHSRLEELQRQAAVNALERARRLAE
ncbi:MAG TPA: SIMPL domain-containing protein, partial [Desulfobaccales bacterium]|nr:SIMPL domain-containing protein [Desulfobaccales bacterium]